MEELLYRCARYIRRSNFVCFCILLIVFRFATVDRPRGRLIGCIRIVGQTRFFSQQGSSAVEVWQGPRDK